MAKKNRQVHRSILRRLEAERWERRLLERAKRKARRTPEALRHDRVSAARVTRGRFGRRTQVILDVPAMLDLVSTRTETCKLVQDVVRLVRRGDRVCLNFEAVTRIRTPALAYLLAAIHRMRLEYGRACVTGTYPPSPAIERQLAESGFYRLLGVKSKFDGRPSKAVRYIAFKSEQRISAREITQLRLELLRDDLRMPTPVARTIFRALSEAMTNVTHHAYHRKSYAHARTANQVAGRWWMMATVNLRRDLFSLVFYDAGVGIPKTLPRTHTIEKIREVLSVLPFLNPDDGQMIEAAMALGRTRTELDNRGKGLLDLARLIDQVQQGEMRIFSRHGCFAYTPRGSRATNHDGFVEGTLIEWQLSLTKALEALPQELYEEAENET